MKLNNKGFSILIAIIIIVLLAFLGIMGLSILTTETQMTVDTTTSAQAFFIAEGGLQYYFEQLQGDSDWTTPPAPPFNKTLANGTFTITTANATANEIDVTSTANVTGIDGGTTIRIANAHFSRGGELVSCSYAIYTSGNYTPGALVVGDVTTGATIFPTVDYTYYYNLAPVAQRIPAGPGSYNFPTGTQSGIWYIDDSVTIRSNTTLNGMIIATGSISCTNKNNVTITATGTYPALVSQSSISFSQMANLNITGMIYSGTSGSGGTNITNSSGTVLGKIMAQGNVNVSGSGSLTITYDATLKDRSWPGFSGGGGIAGMSSWKET